MCGIWIDQPLSGVTHRTQQICSPLFMASALSFARSAYSASFCRAFSAYSALSHVFLCCTCQSSPVQADLTQHPSKVTALPLVTSRRSRSTGLCAHICGSGSSHGAEQKETADKAMIRHIALKAGQYYVTLNDSYFCLCTTSCTIV